MTAPDKSQIVAELAKHTGGADKGDTVKNFLKTLAENNRLSLLEGICEKFGILMGAYRGEVELIVTSASVRILALRLQKTLWNRLILIVSTLKQLDSKTLNRLETAIAKSHYVEQGKKLKVTNKVRSIR